MEYFLIPFVAFSSSILTFFSGFGLGTLLLPAFAIFFPADVAVGLTAIVHLLNNIFKGGLIGKNANWRIVLKFGLPSVVAAFFGALLLNSLSGKGIFFHFEWNGKNVEVTFLKFFIGTLMVIFSLFDLIPFLKKLEFSEKLLIPGGLISGFFGGFSGHQGALRTAFLVRLKLPKEIFIATGIIVAILVDVTRLGTYFSKAEVIDLSDKIPLLIISVLSAFVGAMIGNYLLKKVTLNFLQVLVGIMICVFGVGMMVGMI